MKKYYLGIDGGGTKTDALCVDEEGQVVGQGSSGPTNLTSTSIGAATFNLLEAVRQATESLNGSASSDSTSNGSRLTGSAPSASALTQIPIECLVMGLAGIDTPQELEQAHQIFSQSLNPHYALGEFFLFNDSVVALENATDNPDALVLISGTGSVCFGHNQSGTTARTGGMDFLLSDQGSGYEIGRLTLRAAVKSYDGRRDKSLLEELVCRHFRIRSILDLKNKAYNPLLSKIEVADLAPVCLEAFSQNDPAATKIVEKTISELELKAATVIEALGFHDQEFDCVLSGAILGIDYIKQHVVQKLQSRFRGLQPRFPQRPPVHGAVKLALSPDKRSLYKTYQGGNHG